ncbi:Kappa-carrageenase precursor [Planctomycetes bacterium CA13]|uniref:Kappa-carrageenase n=1 Tax=Novipirellula herctigrandis TaxID=2527986 RepID=A0A5C5Z8S3_9BACT|nr:Kappa-carrageenase precursor [Planctomycetes bacterium CA13]
MKIYAKKITFTIMFLSLATMSFAMAEDPKPYGDLLKDRSADWQFVPALSDEFNGDQVDTNKWNIDTEDWGTWSWEPGNAFQKDGSLHLQMVQETHQRGNQKLFYKSGIARSPKTITYGYFEAKVKGCSRFPGASPAFWLHSKGPENRYAATDGETVAYSEIDVIELQQCEYDFKTKKHNDVNRIDCNLHTILVKDGKKQWLRPNMDPAKCKNEYDSPWDPRDDYHVYAVENTKDTIVWYIDGKEVARKANLYWHLPMHVTLSLGLRYPFEAYKDGKRIPVPEKTTLEGFPTTMFVDYVRVWQNSQVASQPPTYSQVEQPKKAKAATDMTKEDFVAMEKAKWEKNGWPWNQAKVESNFAEIDTNKDAIASGLERQQWFKNKMKSTN